ncbi:MAG: tRNA (guanine(46)-N(7))-methyltransferase TrmB [Planctomycetota bacterium]
MPSKSDLIIEPVALPEDGLGKPIDLNTLYGNGLPIEVEIGSGKGTFLVREAARRTDVNFLGIEWARFYWRSTCDRLRRNGLGDRVRMARADASVFLRDHIADASVAAFHVYFPDPWPKARHNKRRLIQPPFLDTVCRCLVNGGTIRAVTDHPDYAEQIETVFKAGPLRVDRCRRGTDPVVETNFENKYREEGRTFLDVIATKI